MSIATVTPKHVEEAIYAVLFEFLDIIDELYGEDATERLLNRPPNLPEGSRARGQREHRLISGGVGAYAKTLGAYVWQGDTAGGLHSENTWPEVALLGDVVDKLAGKLKFDLSERVGEFGDASELIGGNTATDIVKWTVAGFMARGKLDWLGDPLTIEELAALARVSEKTLRMAANPKNPGALMITKQGHRTVITIEDALEWLSRRPDFVPTRRPNQQLSNHLVVGGTAVQFKSYLDGLARLNPRLREAATASGFSGQQAAALLAGDLTAQTFAFEPGELMRFAHAAGIEQPTAFARWALELQHRERVEQMEADFRQQVLRLSLSEALGDGP
ncbi:helix-turn-helix domain-containing protein [Aquimonas voraii]|uniref:Uncharacterized protein n=1 Tax=Aquimonas voraii TaxID=265719 RepID=A0A1G6Z3V4_9GAMM|nr:helix-turn-helix domain-containing protein [Aquimonas voraii]SDD96637.1 hypothetical protein SAMN04488509_1123 [Aquimonas voraii]